MSWDGPTAAWWREEVARDPAYPRDVDPLLDEVLGSDPGGVVLDLGCGDGRVAHRYAHTVGVDRSIELLGSAPGPSCAADVLHLPFATDSVGAAYAVLVIEHLPEPGPFFEEVGRVVASGGWLSVVVNHPLWTAPGSGPFVDPSDGEVLWRWGGYLDPGHADEPAGEGTIRFHHRPLGALLTAAADAGWSLERLVERSILGSDDVLLALQTEIPRLLGVRWRR